MDYLYLGLLLALFGNGLTAVLAYQVGRASERREAEVKMLRASVAELKAVIAGADFKALAALRDLQSLEAEAHRARQLLEISRAEE